MKNIATYRPYFAWNDKGRPEIRLLAMARDKGLPTALHAFHAPISGSRLEFRSMNAEIARLVENAPQQDQTMVLFGGETSESKHFSIPDAFTYSTVTASLQKMNGGIGSAEDLIPICQATVQREITPFYPDACLSFENFDIVVESKTALAARVQTRSRAPLGLSTSRSIRQLHVWI